MGIQFIANSVKIIASIFAGSVLTSCSTPDSNPVVSDLEGKPILSLSVVEKEPLTQAQRDRIYPLIRSRKGSSYSQSRLEQDIRDLYHSGYVEDVAFFAETENGAIRILAEIEVHPVLESRSR
jgi:outer membrane protein assembly factor BamA